MAWAGGVVIKKYFQRFSDFCISSYAILIDVRTRNKLELFQPTGHSVELA